MDATNPNVCYLKQAGGGWTVQYEAGCTSGTVQGVSVQVPPGTNGSVQQITTIQVGANIRCSPQLTPPPPPPTHHPPTTPCTGCVPSRPQTVYNNVTNNYVTYQLNCTGTAVCAVNSCNGNNNCNIVQVCNGVSVAAPAGGWAGRAGLG